MKSFLFEHTKPRPNRPGFIINRTDFDQASSRLQEFLCNWEYYRIVATNEQLLCEVEYLVPQFAHHVEEYGYQGEGAQLAAHRRNKTTTIESVYSHGDDQVETTYSQARDNFGNDPVLEEPPIRRRVGAKSKASDFAGARGAASGAPGRSSSIGSWLGREFLPPHKKGKGKGKEIQEHWKTLLVPKQPDYLPPNWNPSLGTAPPPKAKPPIRRRQGSDLFWVVPPARNQANIPLVEYPVARDRYDYGQDPFEGEEEVWRDPE